MKPTLALLVILAAAQSALALNAPHIRIRQDTNATSGLVCQGASVVSNTTFVAGAATLEIAKFSCAPVSPFIQAHGGGLLGWLGGLLGWLFPFPLPVHKPKPTTVTKVSTATKTATVVSTATAVTTATATETATETETETATETETETATSATTVVESTTDTATVTVTQTASPPTSTATDVCGEICTTVCGESGQLPPDSEDCATLVDSITILNGQIPPTFTVEPDHVQTITFGTCRFFFENVGPEPLEYCWLSLAQTASASASACFPPTQPVMSEGLCIASDALWEVGVAHS
ncbi:hypothetical protein PYCCODRAFT_1426585 [Trametes coccinea BRFM310]|uniref:Uncharacterized protein n=1 Tax=Trametes coccinea (strain BRFM310) TaxID=1353009 RepID=A0A1Y2III7_TRAC3|nr:hypothetical protein PYCCODRAFT_1426585 [Trametes coccinea BRFM310]